MSEMTITIPLSSLSGVKELSPQGIIDALTINQKLIEEVSGLQNRIEAHRNVIRDFASSLEQIADADISLMEKATRYRELAKQVKETIK
jgi:hypothetical protein